MSTPAVEVPQVSKDLVPLPSAAALSRMDFGILSDPEKELADAERAAKALMKYVEHRPKAIVKIGDNKHLRFEALQFLGRFYGVTAAVILERTKPLRDEAGTVIGYEAAAEALWVGDRRISAATSQCQFDEERGGKRQWEDKPDFQVASMAQTRACAKALRNVLGWIVMLAGFETTPAEEMEGQKRSARTGKASDRPAPARSQDAAGIFTRNGQRNWTVWWPKVREAAQVLKTKDFAFISQLVDREIKSSTDLSDEEFQRVYDVAAAPPVPTAPVHDPIEEDPTAMRHCEMCGAEVTPEVAAESKKVADKVLCGPHLISTQAKAL